MKQEKSLDPQLWHACAGPLVQIPSVDSRVFYFAQGHAEHAHAPPDFQAPRVPPLILCRVVAVKFLADAETDQVHAKITLLPLPGNDQKDLEDDFLLGLTPRGGNRYDNGRPASFAKTLTQSDVNNDGEFSVLRYWAETIFPPLDYAAEPPVQTLIAKDIHGVVWKFRHVYSGKPRRHLLTTGWRNFVRQRELIAGDSIVFLRSESDDLCVGIRRAKHGGLRSSGPGSDNNPYSWFSGFLHDDETTASKLMMVKRSSGEMNTAERAAVDAVAEAIARAACGQAFEVDYYPRASTAEFCVNEDDVKKARMIRWCPGMRINMPFETATSLELSPGITWFMGTVSAVELADPIRWPDSPWRLLQVEWDKPDLLRNVKRVSPWQVESLSDMTDSFPTLATLYRESTIWETQGTPEPFDGLSYVESGADFFESTIAELTGLEKSHRKLKMDQEEEWAIAVRESLSDAKRSRKTEGSGDSGSGSSREVFGLDLQEMINHEVAQTSFLKAAKETTREAECILVFSCNGDDLEELRFIRSIARKLQVRKATPLTYNLSGRKNIDTETLHRFSVGIVVLSHSYVCCRQSLDHLVAIMELRKAKNLVIIPIFYKVTLSDICGLEGRFEAAFLQYLNSDQPGRVQKWKAAMAEIASIDGHEWKKETQGMLAQEVARNACIRLYLKNSKNMVNIIALLKYSQPSGADIVGIWGMAGIGKTSIAREIFGTLAPQYDLCYFLQDFYLMSQTRGLRQMREDFYSKLFGEEKLSIGSSDMKTSFMRDLFHKKTILLVLDDVSNARDAEAAVGGFGWFSHGHRIILTSRRKQVLVQCKVKEPYEVQRLCEFESSRLCKQYFNGESGIISRLMSCTSGIPLAIKVLGSTVSNQHVNKINEHLQSLRRNPPTQIQEAFRRSFDGLDENEKNIFLDLACFFGGENKDYVVRLLDACGFRTYLGICDLIDESLISLLDNRIEIPIPFQDIGRFIVHEEAEDPCERSRLWDSNDIADVLTNNSGTEAVEGIFLDASDLNCELSPSVFGKMYRLRLLKFYCSTSGNRCKLSLPQGLDTLPDELRLLHWENYPLKYLPQKFNPENLVEVNMPYSNMEKLWEEKKYLEKLKKINLNHSRNLADIQILSEALNLEHIDLEGCTSLVDVSTSIHRCGKLVSLNMKDCSHLRSLPAMADLTSLKHLNLSGCSELEEIQDFAPNLKELNLAGTAIRELPLSIENLSELVTLDLENCRWLQQLPSGLNNSGRIVELKLSGCTSLVLKNMETSANSPSPLLKRKR